MNDFFSSAIGALKEYVDGKHGGNVSAAARAMGISVPTFHTWLKGERKPSLSKITPVLEELGARIQLLSEEPAKDVCFVNAKVMPAGEHVAPPRVEDYIAAPLVGEVGAGPGYFSQDEVQSWFLVYKNVPAIMHRRNLIAVEIGPRSTSMQPMLNPGDIVLVDRDDQDPSHAGRIMLVRDPDGAGMIKRVAMEKDGHDWQIQFYSDNAAENPPKSYKLGKDYGGDITKAIVGRVIWSWSDVSNK